MKAMILAAGRGERMRPLTDTCPKPLLPIGGKPLIAWHLERLAAAGFSEVVINHAHCGELIEAALGDGRRWNLRISYSAEPLGALETAGGIVQALPMLGEQPFLVINGDIFCDWSPHLALRRLSPGKLAHLVLVPNPPQHPNGDFILDGTAVKVSGAAATSATATPYTFSGIGIYDPKLFTGIAHGTRAKLAPVLINAIENNTVDGELHSGRWVDVGTPDRLVALDAEISSGTPQ